MEDTKTKWEIILTGQSEPSANCPLPARREWNKYDPPFALSTPSFFLAASASSNKWSGCHIKESGGAYRSIHQHIREQTSHFRGQTGAGRQDQGREGGLHEIDFQGLTTFFNVCKLGSVVTTNLSNGAWSDESERYHKMSALHNFL